MAPEKAPAFQFYPKDYLSDPRVKAMSFEQRGLYFDAICYCWLEESLPADPAELAAILGCAPKRFAAIWARVGLCFTERDGRLFHKRLDRERQAQADSRERRRDAAQKRWEKEHKADAMHMQSTVTEPSPADAKQCSPSSSASSTSTSSSTAVRERAPLQGSGAYEPGSLPRDHLRHTLCGPKMRICLLSWQFDALAKAYNAPENPHGTRAVIAQFIEQLEAGLSAESSIGAFSWVEKEFHTYLKSIGRVPPKLTPKTEPFSLAKAFERQAAREAK